MKCGICQKYRRPESTPAPGSSLPAAAAQPMSGGMAPTTAPTQVFTTLICFSGVYTATYSAMLAAPSAAVVGLACNSAASRSP